MIMMMIMMVVAMVRVMILAYLFPPFIICLLIGRFVRPMTLSVSGSLIQRAVILFHHSVQ